MPETNVLTPEEARSRLLSTYKAGNETSFFEMLKRPALDPIDQRDSQGRRRLHPLVVVGGFLVLLAIASTIFFTLHK